jgi:uncharacterized protein YndB with AHSA1/START domain
MKWLLRIVWGVLGLVVLLLAVGWLLPSQYRVERSVVIAAPADKVYGLIVDPREWKRWTVWNQRDPAMQMSYDGAASGAGAEWKWDSKTEGKGAMKFTEAVASERIGYALSFEDFGMTSTGRLQLSAAEAVGKPGTRVVWSNEGNLGANPVNRWFGVFADKLIGPDFEAGLVNLKKLAEAN